MTRTITLLSGKGGVGKTNIAANLAIALGRQGRRVLLVDGDLSLSSLDLLMGVMPRHTAADVVAGRATLKESLVESYAGVRVLPSSSGDDDLANLDDFRRQKLFRGLNSLGDSFDLILIDAGAGVGRNVTSLARLGGENLIVTTPEPPSISAAFSLLKILDRSGLDRAPGIVVNQATGSVEAMECWNRIVKACKQFLTVTPEYWGWLSLDPAVPAAVRSQEPFILSCPNGPAAKSIVRLAQRVLQNDPVHPPEGVGRPIGARERLAG
ncbi:MAG: flagellar biosynthesis protein FlhG [bacterium]|nr:MAG: flagellar biosynthesis protein FlhG [bacterium]